MIHVNVFVGMEPLPGGVHSFARRESDLGPPNGADPPPHSEAEAWGHEGGVAPAFP